MSGVGDIGILSGVASVGQRRQWQSPRRPHFGESGLLGRWLLRRSFGDRSRFYATGIDGTAVPVAVVGVGGTGTLSGVASVTSVGCATDRLLRRPYFGGVGLLGNGCCGDLGDGIVRTGSGNESSATPVAVAGVGGTGTLSGVASVTSDGMDAELLRRSHFGGSGLLGRWPQWGASATAAFTRQGPSAVLPRVAVMGVGGAGERCRE